MKSLVLDVGLTFEFCEKHKTSCQNCILHGIIIKENFFFHELTILYHNHLANHPIRVVEQGNYHVIVVTKCSGVQHPMISMLFIP